jgi:hypothetical protein
MGPIRQAHTLGHRGQSSIVIGNAAFDVAVSVHPQERVLLRQGIRVIREHVPKIDLVREPSMAPGSGGA